MTRTQNLKIRGIGKFPNIFAVMHKFFCIFFSVIFQPLDNFFDHRFEPLLILLKGQRAFLYDVIFLISPDTTRHYILECFGMNKSTFHSKLLFGCYLVFIVCFSSSEWLAKEHFKTVFESDG